MAAAHLKTVWKEATKSWKKSGKNRSNRRSILQQIRLFNNMSVRRLGIKYNFKKSDFLRSKNGSPVCEK